MPAQTNQRIDGKRLWDSLMSMAQIGATPKGGVRRLTLTDVDKRGRDRFRAECEAAGLTVRVDAIGNMFARRPGRDPNRLPVLFGSHLDSQPSGGKYDGALGVLAGLEVMHSLNDLGIVTEAPVELVNWTDDQFMEALQIYGYDVTGPANLPPDVDRKAIARACCIAFCRHFRPAVMKATPDAEMKTILAGLVDKLR